MGKITFDCCNNLFEAPQRCTREWLNEKLHSPDVLQLVESYRIFRREADKKLLPALTPHAYFTDGSRKSESAVASGLLMLDIDDHEGTLGFDPRQHFEKYIQPLLSTTLSRILMVYVTASGNGLRVIAKRTRCTDNLSDEQLELFADVRGNLPYEAFDKSCHDLTRLSFLTSHEDVLYLNDVELFDGEVSEGFGGKAAADPDEAKATPSDDKGVNAAFTPSLPIRPEVAALISEDGAYYGEVAYTDIVSDLIRVDRLNLNKGNRNNAIYRLACQLRTICRSEEHLLKLLPYSGLSAAEMAETVHSACKAMSEGEPLDSKLQLVLDSLSITEDADQMKEPAMPSQLPPFVKTIIEPIAEGHRAAMIMCALPMLGALATRFRLRYLNDEVHSLTFETVLVAEQARGKSTMSKLHNLLLDKIIKQDEKNREEIDQWRLDRAAAGESGAGPRQPQLSVRDLNPRTTYPTFVDFMKYARGKHLFICAPEIQTLPMNQWFQHGSTLRLAFDNERGGQDTKSVNATSGYIPFYCNTCLSGTPKQVQDYYRNAEDGLVTRTIFCTFPQNERGIDRVREKARSESNLKKINEMVDLLMSYGEVDKSECEPVRLPKIEKAILNFYRMKGELYNMTLNEGIETFRTRAAVIGMRAGALAWLLEGKKETRRVIDFALYVAEYTLFYQVKFFGKKLEEAVADNRRVMAGQSLSSNDVIFATLADDFTNSDMADIFRSRGKQGTGVSQTGKRWEDNHWVERVGRGKWRKTELGKQRASLFKESLSFPSVAVAEAAADIEVVDDVEATAV